MYFKSKLQLALVLGPLNLFNVGREWSVIAIQENGNSSDLVMSEDRDSAEVSAVAVHAVAGIAAVSCGATEMEKSSSMWAGKLVNKGRVSCGKGTTHLPLDICQYASPPQKDIPARDVEPCLLHP